MAEHYLSAEDLTPASPFSSELKDAIFLVNRRAGFSNIAEEASIRRFNRLSRFHQLNLVAMALNEAGCQPKIEGEFWHIVRNPFRSSEDTHHLKSTAYRLKSKVGGTIQLRSKSLRMSATGVVDA